MCPQAFSEERACYRVRLGGGKRKNLLATRTDSVQLFTVKEVPVVSWPTGLIARCGRARWVFRTGQNNERNRCGACEES
jgi:hypothetical protein